MTFSMWTIKVRGQHGLQTVTNVVFELKLVLIKLVLINNKATKT